MSVHNIEDLVSKAKILQESLPYIRDFHGKTFVIKYGGSAMTHEHLRESFAKDVVLLKYIGINVIVVHGGGPQINKMLDRLGIRQEFVGGLRRTDEETMHIVEMVLSGDINKDIVALINRHSGENIYAVGISGRDGRLLKAKKADTSFLKEMGIEVADGDLGYVGRVVEVNTDILESLMEKNYIPVIAPIGVGEKGEAYNINADISAGEIASYLKAEKLIFLTDTQGVMDEKGEVLSTINKAKAEDLIKDGVIKGGMIPKVKYAIRSLERGVKKAHIIDGRVEHSLLLEIFTKEGIGTEITLN